MSGKIPADADRYRADGYVGRRQLTEALAVTSFITEGPNVIGGGGSFLFFDETSRDSV